MSRRPPLDLTSITEAPTIRALEAAFQRLHPTVKWKSSDYYRMRDALQERGWQLVDQHQLGEWVPRVTRARRCPRAYDMVDVTFRGESGRFLRTWGAVDLKEFVRRVGEFRLVRSRLSGVSPRSRIVDSMVDWILCGYPHRAIRVLQRSGRFRHLDTVEEASRVA